MSTGLSVPTLKRGFWRCPLPESARPWPTDPAEVVIEAPSLAQELDAAKAQAAKGLASVDVAYDVELLRRCVVEINGQPITNHDWIEETSSQCRAVLRVLLATMVNVPAGFSLEELLKKTTKSV